MTSPEDNKPHLLEYIHQGSVYPLVNDAPGLAPAYFMARGKGDLIAGNNKVSMVAHAGVRLGAYKPYQCEPNLPTGGSDLITDADAPAWIGPGPIPIWTLNNSYTASIDDTATDPNGDTLTYQYLLSNAAIAAAIPTNASWINFDPSITLSIASLGLADRASKSLYFRVIDTTGRRSPIFQVIVQADLDPLEDPTFDSNTSQQLTEYSKATVAGTCEYRDSNSWVNISINQAGGYPGAGYAALCPASGNFSVELPMPVGSVDVMISGFTDSGYNSSSSTQTYTLAAFAGCPPGYLPVVGGVIDDFCIAKFEMKPGDFNYHPRYTAPQNVGLDGDLGFANPYYPASVPKGTPWTSLTQREALQVCDRLNDKNGSADGRYRLISNTQWQRVAKVIAADGVNWTSGTVDIEGIPRGHSNVGADPAGGDGFDNNLQTAIFLGLAAAPWNGTFDESASYLGTNDSSGELFEDGQSQARHLRVNGTDFIWDFAGNVAEWVRFDIDTGSCGGACLDPSVPAALDSYLLPSGSPTDTWELDTTVTPGWHTGLAGGVFQQSWFFPASPPSGFTHAAGFGRITVGFNEYLARGGALDNVGGAGINSVDAGLPNTGSPLIGFRCVYEPY